MPARDVMVLFRVSECIAERGRAPDQMEECARDVASSQATTADTLRRYAFL